MRIALMMALSTAAILAMAGPAVAEDAEGKEGDQGKFSFEKYLAEAHSFGAAAISVGPDSIGVDWQGIQLGEQASADLREIVDGMFNSETKDGVVDEEELEDATNAFRLLIESEFGQYADNEEVNGLVRIDQSTPQSAEVTAFDVEGLLGDVKQGGQVTIDVALDVAFPESSSDETLHTVRLDMGPYYFKEGHEDQAKEVAGDFQITVGAADEWNIDPASIQPTCVAESYQDGELVFTGEDIDCFTGRSGQLLAFTIQTEPDHFLPGPGGAFLAGIVALGAIALRRRY